jgi:hypothetical protein
MLNVYKNVWVKNVNNQRTQRSITSDSLSTYIQAFVYTFLSIGVQPWVIRFTLPDFTQSLSTYKNIKNNLLHRSFTHNPQHLLIERIKEI